MLQSLHEQSVSPSKVARHTGQCIAVGGCIACSSVQLEAFAVGVCDLLVIQTRSERICRSPIFYRNYQECGHALLYEF